jgi:hypothetical protein
MRVILVIKLPQEWVLRKEQDVGEELQTMSASVPHPVSSVDSRL